jgi:hypothetical protein
MEDTIKNLFEVDPKKIPSSIPLFPIRKRSSATLWKTTTKYI